MTSKKEQYILGCEGFSKFHVSSIFNKSFIEVNEEGAGAAASDVIRPRGRRENLRDCCGSSISLPN